MKVYEIMLGAAVACGTQVGQARAQGGAIPADVAMVAGKSGPMVFSIFTYDNVDTGWTADNEGELTIAEMARAIVEAWSPEGIDGKTLAPGLGLAPARPKGGAAASN